MNPIILLIACIASASAFLLDGNVTPQPSTFRAAVYEHRPIFPFTTGILSRPEALKVMRKNLKIYEENTQQAKKQGAQIIVFPEYGIYGMSFVRKSIFNFLEKIPDPKSVDWNPCKDPKRFPDTEVTNSLSCIAKNNGIYLVANMGDLIPCDRQNDPQCPKDGRYQYNTDVAFSPDGKLIAKYHKTHLFNESPLFDRPKPEAVYFDTPFGRFGMIICFDSIFKHPAVDLITKHNVTNIVLPTAWPLYLPYMSAIGYHSSFARGMGVNVLAANVHFPIAKVQGSGIYTPDGEAAFYYDDEMFSLDKLLVATVNVVKRNKYMAGPGTNYYAGNVNPNNEVIRLDRSKEFQSKVLYDLYTFRSLEKSQGAIRVCHRETCCSLTYSYANTTQNQNQKQKERFALGAYDGTHTVLLRDHIQVCILLKCANEKLSSCGSPTKASLTRFDSLTLKADVMDAPYTFPQVLLSKDADELSLPAKNTWTFKDKAITVKKSHLEDPLLAVTIFGCYFKG